MSITLDYNNMMSEFIQHGITQHRLRDFADMARCAHGAVEANRGKGMQEWMLSPYVKSKDIKRILEVAAKARKFRNFVVLGIGGSALGPIAVFTALKHLYYNELPDEKRGGPRFYVVDNVDPERMNALFDVIDVEDTMFNVITKSGSTSETMSQYLIVMDMLTKKLGDKAAQHVVATTSESKGNLIKLAQLHGFETLYIPDGVGGRFSELSPVGLLPAAVVGIDVEKLLQGAREMDEKCKTDDLFANPALMCAVLQVLSVRQGKNVGVIMPYADSLKYVADWYSQLWAESLGKQKDRSGRDVFAGQTPVKALGVTDQHSQVQLYNEGPFDKVITFIEVKNFRSDVVIPDGCSQFPNVNFLCGHTLQQLINTELYATRYNLAKMGRCSYTITLDSVDEYHVGAMLYMFQLQTAYAGELLNVDAYDQPGVEGGKNAAYALFGRKGYEHLAEEMRHGALPLEKYIIK